MACDVRIVTLLVVLHVTAATDFGLEYSIDPAPEVVVPPGATVTLDCQTNLPSDEIAWHLNHAPLLHISNTNHSDWANNSDTSSSHPVNEEFHPQRTNSDTKLFANDGDCGNDRNGSCLAPPYRVINYGNHTSTLYIHVGSVPKLYEQQLGIYQCIAILGSISLASSASRLDVAVIAPFADHDSSEVMAAEGAAVSIPCPRPSSIPPAQLSFTRDGHPLLLDNNRMSVLPSGDLLIASVSSSLAGVYRCSATNPVLGTALRDPATTTLSVEHHMSAPAQIISPSPGMIIVTQGEGVRLFCLSNQLPRRVKTQWTLQDTSPSRRRPSNSSSLPSPVLWSATHPPPASIPLDGPEHAHYNGEDTEDSTTRNVTGASVFPKGSIFFLPNISSNASGKYVCSGNVSGQSDVLTSVVELYVQAPPLVVSGLVSGSLSEGQRLQVRCVFSGRPAPLLTWLSNGKRLVQGKEVTMLPDGSLIIATVSKQLAGVLQCFGHNAAGSASSHAFYTVTPNTVHGGDTRYMGTTSGERQTSGSRKYSGLVRTISRGGSAPSRPTVARAADDAVRLVWTPPRRRQRLLFYKVQYRVVQPRHGALPAPLPGLPPFTGSGGRQWRTDDTTIHAEHNTSLVAGLTPGLTYKFRVAAVFAGQDDRVSPASPRFLLRRGAALKAPSSAPSIQSVWRDSSGLLGVSWQYSSDTETDGFIIVYREAGTDRPYTKLRYLGGGRRRLSLTEVPPGPAYDLRVQAFNMAGSSPPSPARTVAKAAHVSDKSQLLIPKSLRGSASNLQTSSAPGVSDSSDVSYAPKNTSDVVPSTRGSKSNEIVPSTNRNNDIQVLHPSDITKSDSRDDVKHLPSYEDRSLEYEDYYEMDSDESDADTSEEDDSGEKLSRGRSGGGAASSLSSKHLLVLLVCVLLGLLALVVVSYLLYARREKRGYGQPAEQFVLEGSCTTAPSDGRHCLQPLGSPMLPPTAASAPYRQEPSLLSMPD